MATKLHSLSVSHSDITIATCQQLEIKQPKKFIQLWDFFGSKIFSTQLPGDENREYLEVNYFKLNNF